MPVELSSSSSDEELQIALRRNVRSENEERAQYRLQCRVTYYNGELLEVRYGTVFCALRKKYFYVRLAKQNPAAFFGDSSVKKKKRKFISPSSVLLWDVSHGEGRVDKCPKITLVEANDRGFFVFDGLKKSSDDARRPMNRSFLQDFRFSRIMWNSQFSDDLYSPSQLYTEADLWLKSSYAIPRNSLLVNLTNGSFAFYVVDSHPKLCIVEDDLVQSVQMSTSEVVFEDIICAHAAGRDRMLVVEKKRLHYVSWDLDTVSPSAFCITTPLTGCLCSCSCLNYSSGGNSDRFISLASERSLFCAQVGTEASFHVTKLCTFRTTPISALDTFSESFLSGKVIICGMRNGTIQLQPLQMERFSRSFDSMPRHKAASVSYVKSIQNSYNFVSISSNGECKLWDARYMWMKDPVVEYGTSICTGGMFGVEATFVDDFACLSFPNGRFDLFNIRKSLTIGQYRQIEGSRGRLHLVKSLSGYVVMDANDDETKVFPLHIM